MLASAASVMAMYMHDSHRSFLVLAVHISCLQPTQVILNSSASLGCEPHGSLAFSAYHGSCFAVTGTSAAAAASASRTSYTYWRLTLSALAIREGDASVFSISIIRSR